MKRLLVLLSALIASGALTGVSQASVTITNPDQFFFTSGPTIMKLTNYESEVNKVNGTAGLIEVGDRLRGIFAIKESNLPGDPEATRKLPSGFEVTGIFDIKVNNVMPIGVTGNALFEFVPEPSFETTYGAGAMMAAFYDTTPDFTGLGTIASTETSATDGSLYMVLGAKGVLPAEPIWGTDYYWASNGSLTPSVSSFAASLALLTNNSGIPSSEFLKVTQTEPFSPDPPSFTNELNLATILNEFGLQGNTVAVDFDDCPYDIVSQDPLKSRVIPEPSSLLTMAGLFGVWGLFLFWRKRRV